MHPFATCALCSIPWRGRCLPQPRPPYSTLSPGVANAVSGNDRLLPPSLGLLLPLLHVLSLSSGRGSGVWFLFCSKCGRANQPRCPPGAVPGSPGSYKGGRASCSWFRWLLDLSLDAGQQPCGVLLLPRLCNGVIKEAGRACYLCGVPRTARGWGVAFAQP